MNALPRARVYIDGFNLYRRCLEPYPELKWLDVVALSQRLLPEFSVEFVHYFTANLRPGLVTDPGSVSRQQIYLRALESMESKLKIHKGKFRSDIRFMPKHPLERHPELDEYIKVPVRKLEEKGSDVNLASRMVFEASRGMAEIYVVLTNDSDQVGPIRILQDEIGVAVGVIFPMETTRFAKELVKTEPSVTRCVSRNDLLACQLPDRIEDRHGQIHRPEKWRLKSESPASGAL